MIKNEKLIIFDMDGTLIDSGNVITNTINYVREKSKLTPLSKEIMLEALNDPSINSALFFYGTDTFTKSQTMFFQEYYDEHCISDIVLYDGIEELLKTLCRDFNLSVATNANSVYAYQMLDFLGIKDYFSLIVGADMVVKPKPSGEMLAFSCNQLEVKKENAILIGDSKKDLFAAKDFGIDCILVNWGFTKHTKDEVAIHDTKSLKCKIYEMKGKN
jgi:phosphoglycolate phosphatase